MSDKRTKIILPIVILVVGFAGTFAMLKSRQKPETRPPEQFAPLVRVIDVTPTNHQLIVRTQGTVTPRTQTTVVAEVAGRVLSTAPDFASGGFFDAGKTLVTIDPADYELAVVTARSALAQAKVRLETEQARAKVAQEEWDELGDGSGSPLATRELQVDEVRAALAAAEGQLRKAERDLARTKVSVPFDSRIRRKLADVGQYVTPGTPIAVVYATDYVEIPLPIPDTDLAYLDVPLDYRGEGVGPEVRLHAEFAGEQRTWKGRVVRLEGEIDPVTRMVNVVAQVDDPFRTRDGRPPLGVGMFVDAEIMGRVTDGVVILPRLALRGDNQVLVVDEESRLRFRDVTVVKSGREEVVIGSGLGAGDRVCVSTLEAVTDGMLVRTTEDGAPSESQDEPAESAANASGGRS